MGPRYLVDSNAIIDLVLSRLPSANAAWFDAQLGARQVAISVITRIELLTKTAPASEYAIMLALTQDIQVLPLDEPAIQQTITLRQQHRIKLPDAIIAATALAHGLPLLTRNTTDFRAIAGLLVINPHDPAQLPAT